MRNTRFVVGTDGWSVPHWKGTFYPPGLPQKEWPAFYARRLASVELQNTMYRLPKEAVVEAWRDAVPDDFRFSLKAGRRITHARKLEACAETVAFFRERVAALGPKLGPVLYQLPPTFARDDGRLRAFLAILPRAECAVFEFRHTRNAPHRATPARRHLAMLGYMDQAATGNKNTMQGRCACGPIDSGRSHRRPKSRTSI